MKNLLYIFIGILLFSCETKEYTPNTKEPIDSLLVGTWQNIDAKIGDSSYIVFTDERYYGSSYWINNEQRKGFSDLDGLWYNIEIPDSNEVGIYYKACIYEHWTSKRWESNNYYRISNDTLFIGFSDKESLNNIYIKNAIQLVFEGKFYTGIDSTTAQ